jgi:UDP-N-acetyl-2-amino-2-deoxyglucuronate dehydrogenase
MASFSLIGAAGYIAPRHLRAMHRLGHTLLAAFDPAEAGAAVHAYFPDARIFSSFDAFVLWFREQSTEWVSICSPNHCHRTHIEWALKQGVRVICEKPLVTEPSALEGLAVLERAAGGRLFTVLQLRLLREVQELKALVVSAGRSDHEVVIEYITPRSPAYFASWKGDVTSSGGIVTNIGIHLFDLLIWIFGSVQEIREVEITERRASGVLQLQQARVQWRLSVDAADLPEGAPGFYRRLTVDGKQVTLESGLEELHDRLYAEALLGTAPGIDEARPSIELCRRLMG